MAPQAFKEKPLTWSEIQQFADDVKMNGISHCIRTYKDHKMRKNEPLKWGDEIEYLIVRFDHKNRKVRLAMRGRELFNQLKLGQENSLQTPEALWSVELAGYMLESSPGEPYSGILTSCLDVEANMLKRRKEILKHLNPDEMVLTLTTFPRLGCPDFIYPPINMKDIGLNPINHSFFIPDEAVIDDVRCRQTVQCILEGRGRNPAANIPIYKDKNTPSPFLECFKDPSANQDARPNHVYLDSPVFAGSNCCIQCTLQAADIDEAKYLYDQLAVLCPIMLALTAASPIHRGYLVDTDTRWQAFAECSDDRTNKERGLNVNKQVPRIHTPRVTSIRSYLSNDEPTLNDVPLEMNARAFEMLNNAGVEKTISCHFSHLWVRKLLSLERSQTVFTPQLGYEHFQNIQSTNWQTVRFKPPPPDSDIGWRVEFRIMEAQLSDFENAAFVVFVILLSRVILANKLDILVPISKLDENMTRAQQNNALLTQKFHFKHNLNSKTESCKIKETKQTIPEMTVDEIINGKVGQFPGFVFLIEEYLKNKSIKMSAQTKLRQYLDFISKKASGEIPTTAQWIRTFVTSHTEYARDSRVTESMTYDLLMICRSMDEPYMI